MPTDLKIHSNFFFELGTTPPQGGGYGPSGATNLEKENAFQSTAFFTNSNTIKAIAVLDSQVLIVPQVDGSGAITNKVNLILKPKNITSSPINVRYFVYRGIHKNSFITLNNNNIILHDGSQNNNLIDKLWKRLKQFYYSEIIDPDVSGDQIEAKDVGYFVNLSDHPADTLIDSFFEHKLNDIFNLPEVKQGDWLGEFTDDFGFDIVLNNGVYEETGFRLDLKYARAQKWIFDISEASSIQGFLEKRYRENIRIFIDPAAYWGLHNATNSGIFLYPNNPVDNPSVHIPTGTDTIYSKVLSIFDTKNTFYIDIQSEGARSYDYYNKYNESEASVHNMKVGSNPASLTKQRYATHKWPVLIEQSSQTSGLPYNRVYLKLFQKKNGRAMIFAETGELSGFLDLRNQENAIKVISPQATDAYFTEDIYYDFSNVQIGQEWHCQSNYKKLIYKNTYDKFDSGEIDEDQEKIYYPRNDLSLLFSFDEFSSSSLFNQDQQTIEVMVNKSPNIFGYSLQDGVSRDLFAATETVLAKDIYTDMAGVPHTRLLFQLNNLLFCDHASGRSNKRTLTEQSLNNFTESYDKDRDNSFGFGYHAYRTKEITIKNKHYQLPEFEQSIRNFLIGMDNSSYERLKKTKEDLQLTNAYLYLNLKDYQIKLTYNSQEYYRIAYLTLSGENVNGDEIVVHDPKDSIVLFTFDEFLFSTLDFLDTIKARKKGHVDYKLSIGSTEIQLKK